MATATAVKKFNLVKVPGKLKLAAGLLDSSGDDPNPVEMTIAPSGMGSRARLTHVVRINLTGLQKEDGSGFNWIFEGYIEGIGKVSGYFNLRQSSSNDNCGFMEVTQPYRLRGTLLDAMHQFPKWITTPAS